VDSFPAATTTTTPAALALSTASFIRSYFPPPRLMLMTDFRPESVLIMVISSTAAMIHPKVPEPEESSTLKLYKFERFAIPKVVPVAVPAAKK